MIKNVCISKISLSFILISYCYLIISSCSNDNQTNDNYFDKLNGFWIGSQKIQKVGDCIFSGDSVTNALLKIEITDAGIASIIEYYYIDSLDKYYYIDSVKYQWTGTVDKELKYVFKKPVFVNCFGEPGEYLTEYNGTILNIEDSYQLETNSDEEWCPSENCIFNIEYHLKHVDTLITNIKKYDESDFNKKSAILYRFKN